MRAEGAVGRRVIRCLHWRHPALLRRMDSLLAARRSLLVVVLLVGLLPGRRIAHDQL
jgi:hypothetical protein